MSVSTLFRVENSVHRGFEGSCRAAIGLHGSQRSVRLEKYLVDAIAGRAWDVDGSDRPAARMQALSLTLEGHADRLLAGTTGEIDRDTHFHRHGGRPSEPLYSLADDARAPVPA